MGGLGGSAGVREVCLRGEREQVLDPRRGGRAAGHERLRGLHDVREAPQPELRHDHHR